VLQKAAAKMREISASIAALLSLPSATKRDSTLRPPWTHPP
jgi:hypothetical protein